MRICVDYYWPGTMAGDGRVVTGTGMIEALTPLLAWDHFEAEERRRSRADPDRTPSIALRAIPAEDYASFPPVRELVDWAGLR